MNIAITVPIITILSTTALYAQSKPPAYLFAEITVTDGYGYTRIFYLNLKLISRNMVVST